MQRDREKDKSLTPSVFLISLTILLLRRHGLNFSSLGVFGSKAKPNTVDSDLFIKGGVILKASNIDVGES